MERLNVRSVKSRGYAALQTVQPDFRLLVVKHGLVMLGVQGVYLLIRYFLEAMMADIGGLSGIGSVAALDTVGFVVQLAGSIFLPFWSLGICFAALQVVRGKTAGFSDLAQGLRRFRPILRYYILLLLLFTLVAVAGANALAMVMMFFPMPEAVEEIMLQLDPAALQNPALLLQSLPPEELLAWLTPFYAVYLIVMAAVSLYLNYRLQMSRYILLEGVTPRALQAMFLSLRMTKGNALQLFKLDLSFWWYILASALLNTVASGPVIAVMLGFSLPVSQITAELVCWAISGGGTVLLLYLAGDRIQCAYACAYDTLSGE